MTRKDIDNLVSRIAKLENKAASRSEAIEKGLTHFYYVEYASIYGGYRVVNVSVEG